MATNTYRDKPKKADCIAAAHVAFESNKQKPWSQVNSCGIGFWIHLLGKVMLSYLPNCDLSCLTDPVRLHQLACQNSSCFLHQAGQIMVCASMIQQASHRCIVLHHSASSFSLSTSTLAAAALTLCPTVFSIKGLAYTAGGTGRPTLFVHKAAMIACNSHIHETSF